MAESGANRAPAWLLIIATVALLWNLLGCFAFFQQTMMSEAQIEALPAAEQALYRGIPMWATVAFAVAVFGGAVGSLALLLKRRFALILLTASLIGVLVQMFHVVMLSGSMDVYGPGGMIMPGMIIVIAFGLVWLARSAAKRGWLQ